MTRDRWAEKSATRKGLKDEFYLIVKQETRIWQNVLVKKVKMKGCTVRLAVLTKLTKPTIFS